MININCNEDRSNATAEESKDSQMRSVRINRHEQSNSNQYLKFMYNKPESVGNMTDGQDNNTTTTKQNDKNTTNDTRKKLGR